MSKLSSVLAASALLVGLAAPSFAADIDSSTSHSGSATIQDRDSSASGTSMKGTSSLNDKATDHDRTIDRDKAADKDRATDNDRAMNRDQSVNREQSAQLPNLDRDAKDRDASGIKDKDSNAKDMDRDAGKSAASPGHEMQEHGSVPGAPGASGYAPGQQNE